jgi:dTDP-4-dehydrorhamnose reductase
MRVLVLGGGGQVARAIAAAVPHGCSLIVKTRHEVDVSDEAALMAAVANASPHWLINGAAYAAVDRAESESDLARAINDTAVGSMARAAVSFGCRLMHISTDFVFDGNASRPYLPSDPTNPLGVYAATKLAGERQAIALQDAQPIVLRTAWVYASTGRNFVLTMLRLMRAKEEIRVVSDQIGTPTWAAGVARTIWGLIEVSAASGVYHWTDLGVASWYDFAVAIQEEALARNLLVRPVTIVPISTEDYPTPARRPAFSVLNTESTRALVKFTASHWRCHLRMMLDEL